MAGVLTGFVGYIDTEFREEFRADISLLDFMDMTEHLNVREADYGLGTGEGSGRWYVIFHEDDMENVRRFCDARRGGHAEAPPSGSQGGTGRFLYVDDVMTLTDMGRNGFMRLARTLGVDIITDCFGELEGEFISTEGYGKIRKWKRGMPPAEDMPVYRHHSLDVD